MKKTFSFILAAILLCTACTSNSNKETAAVDETKSAAELNLTTEAKPASEYTAKANADMYTLLDFDDTQESEFAVRGLIDAPEILELTNADGNIVWSQEAYSFLDDYEEAPETANPSLWENTKNNHAYGLFEV